MTPIRCKAGERVKVRSAEDILATLDTDGCSHGMPFMPEMLRYCGGTFPVFKSAHKTCDSTYYRDGRYMEDTVMLDLRCDGSGHDGCEAKCLMFFRLEWLEPVEPGRDWRLPPSPRQDTTGRDEAWLRATTKRIEANGETRYRCQATQHLAATRSFKANDWGMFLADFRSGNASLREVARAMLLQYAFKLRQLPFGWSVWTALYERLHRFIYGTRNPFFVGRIPMGAPTPDVRIGLKEGEYVRVRTLEEIETTLNANSRNRGLSFNPEMSPFCGGTYKVDKIVHRIVDEKDGRMLDMKSPCVIIEGGYCQSRYHPDAVLCPRRIPQYFREAWLERVDGPQGARPAHQDA
jgi:hypothetical protein